MDEFSEIRYPQSQGCFNNMVYQDRCYPHSWGFQNGSHAFDPSIPAFQPNGSELFRYQAPQSSQFAAFDEMKKYVAELNFTHINDQIRIERQTHDNARNIARLEAKWMKTYQALEKKLYALQDDQSEDGPVTQTNRQLIPFPNYDADQDISPPEWWEESVGKEKLAEAYYQEAQRAKRCALKLRSQAEDLLSGNVGQKAVEFSARQGPGQDEISFACCQTVFESFEELLDHVNKAHAAVLPPQPIATDAQSRCHSTGIDIKSSANSYEEEPKTDATYETKVQTHSPVGGTWTPFAVTKMAPFQKLIPSTHIETFTWEFLHNTFGGTQWSSGFYFISKNSKLPSKSYWLLERENEPYLPAVPGKHGAKLSPFFHDDWEGPDPENYNVVPMFICAKGTNEYRYFGNYSQTRFSDKVDYDHLMTSVPDHVRRHWADQLAANGRPEWVTQALMKQFWPQPEYEGRLPTDSAINSPLTIGTSNSGGSVERKVQKDLNRYAEVLKMWEKDARFRVNILTADSIYESFKKPDLDEVPGLRLFWEYFECVDYDSEFFDMLIKMKHNPNLNTSKSGKPGAQRPPTPVFKDDSTAIKKGEIDAKGRPVKPLPLEDLVAIKAEAKSLDKQAHAMQKQAEMDLHAENAKKHTLFAKPPTFANDPFGGQETARTRKKEPEGPNAKHAKPHTAMVKPWETSDRTFVAPGSPDPAAAAWKGVGDMQAAKDFSKEVIHGGEKGGGGKGGRAAAAPHLRGGRRRV